MNFKNEDELQLFIHKVIGGQREVTFSSGKRIDILTSNYAVEVKPKLTRDSIYQAMGQLLAYQRFIGERQLVIAGMTPSDESSSLSTAREAKASGIEVWYVDKLNIFQNAWDESDSQSKPKTYPISLHNKLKLIAAEHDKKVHLIANKKPLHPLNQSLKRNLEQRIGDKTKVLIGIAAIVFMFSGVLRPNAQPKATKAALYNAPNGSVTRSIPSDATVAVKACDRDWALIEWGNVVGWLPEREFDTPVCRQNN